MELSDKTLQVLKNYSTINSNLVIRPGSTLGTISEAKNVVATINVDETFEREFGVYDLGEFLGVLNLVDRPNLSFKDEYVIVSDSSGRSQVKYFYSDTDMLTTNTKTVTMPTPDVEFTLDQGTLNRIKSASSTLGHNELFITGSDGVITLTVGSIDNKTANSYSIEVAGTFPDVPFQFNIGIPNLKLMAGDYTVAISSRLISQFINKETGMSYFIALEKTSTFGV